MSSAGSFSDFIQARDAAGLQVFMTNERHLPSDHIERNNRALFEACRDGLDEICEVLIRFGADVNSAVNDAGNWASQTPLIAAADEDTPVDLTYILDQFIDNRFR